MATGGKNKGGAPKGCYWRNGVLYGKCKIKGRRYRESLKTTEANVASERWKAWRDKLTARLVFGEVDQGDGLVKGVFEKLCHHMRSEGKSENTITRYISSMVSEDALGPYLHGVTVLDVTRRFCNGYIEDRQKAVTNATIRRDLTALSATMEFAMWKGIGGDQLVNVVPMVMRGLDEKRDPIHEPHDDDIALVLELAPGCWPYLIKAALATGCREDELVKADRRAYDAKAKTFTVTHGKGNKKRVIDLRWNAGFKVFDAIPAFAGKPNLFWRHTDKRVREDSKRAPTFRGDPIEDPAAEFHRLVKKAEAVAKERGVQFVPFTFHHLRHRHCIDYLRSGRDIYDLNKRVGHATLKQTEQYLDCVTPEQARIAKYGKSNRQVG